MKSLSICHWERRQSPLELSNRYFHHHSPTKRPPAGGLFVATLHSRVYISCDIDGPDPGLCPHTGTPVPGCLEFHETLYLIKKIAGSKRHIIGFNLCEVSPGQNEWDANNGECMLYERFCHSMVTR
ncbi:MAG: hypothetical protein GY868_08150 [Deltaproteobacteria bacterium]|nr:hypothetical protein [Deltaproteobacteria bacterium]